MSFGPFNTFVDGNALDVADLQDNNEDAKIFVNQGTEAGDLANSSFGFDSFKVGELNPITNAHMFVTGQVHGHHKSTEQLDRAYFTSNTKPRKQVATDVFLYQAIYEAGAQIVLEKDADVLINFGGTVICTQNEKQSSERHASKIILRRNDGTGWVDVNATFGWGYEESFDPAGATVYSGSGLPSEINDGRAFYVDEHKLEKSFRRWICFNITLFNVPAGTHTFGLFVNSRVEHGYMSARNFTAEVFYT